MSILVANLVELNLYTREGGGGGGGEEKEEMK